MYLRHFGLEKSAFSLSPDPSFLYLTEKHREALAALLFAVAESKGFLVITGAAGTGKTTLTQKLLSSLASSGSHVSVLVNPILTPREFLEAVLLGFGERDIPTSKAVRLALLRNMLFRAQTCGRPAVLLIDEAHLLSEELLEEVRLLSNLETPERKLLQIVLAGQNELGSTLHLASLRQLKQRIAIRVHIDPLEEGEVACYMRARWFVGGSSQPLPFTQEAIQLIARCSMGIPRTINILSDAAMVNAYGSGTTLIGTAEIAEVLGDLDFLPCRDSALPFAHANSPALPYSQPSELDKVVIRPHANDRYEGAAAARAAGARTWKFSNWFGAESRRS